MIEFEYVFKLYSFTTLKQKIVHRRFNKLFDNSPHLQPLPSEVLNLSGLGDRVILLLSSELKTQLWTGLLLLNHRLGR